MEASIFSTCPKQKKHTVRDLRIGIPFLSNIPSYVERFVQPHFSAKIEMLFILFEGRTKPFANSLETFLDITIKDVDLPFYMAYVPVKLNFEVPSGVHGHRDKDLLCRDEGKKTFPYGLGAIPREESRSCPTRKHDPSSGSPFLRSRSLRQSPFWGTIHLRGVGSIARGRDPTRQTGSAQRPIPFPWEMRRRPPHRED